MGPRDSILLNAQKRCAEYKLEHEPQPSPSGQSISVTPRLISAGTRTPRQFMRTMQLEMPCGGAFGVGMAQDDAGAGETALLDVPQGEQGVIQAAEADCSKQTHLSVKIVILKPAVADWRSFSSRRERIRLFIKVRLSVIPLSTPSDEKAF